MENKTMEELKKEFDSFNIIHWQWIEQNFRSKQYCLRLIKETEEAHNKAAELKAENEKLRAQLKDAWSRIEELENGYYDSSFVNNTLRDKHSAELAKARKEERAKVAEVRDELERRLAIIQSETDDFTRQAMISNLTVGLLDGIEPQPSEVKIGDN